MEDSDIEEEPVTVKSTVSKPKIDNDTSYKVLDFVSLYPKMEDSDIEEEPVTVKSTVSKPKIDNDTFKELSYKGTTNDELNKYAISIKLYNSLSRCIMCEKVYDKKMVTNEYDENGDPVCYHCLYTFTYNPIDARCNFDGVFGKTIFEYITDCKDYHDIQTCTHQNECFLCDYLNGKYIEGIIAADELIKTNPEEGFRIAI